MNAVLQSLSVNLKLKNGLAQFLTDENSELEKPIIFSLNKLFNEIKDSNQFSTTINPTYFKLALLLKDDIFKGSEQFDA